MKVAILDLDGTLVDTLDDLAAAVNAALDAVGLPRRPRDEIRRFVGEGARVLVSRAVAPREDLVEPALEAWWRHYEANLLDRTRPYPGVPEALAAATRTLAVHTNKPGRLARRILDGLGLRDRFVEVVGGDEGPRKPDPAGTLGILRRLGARPDEAVFVGDSRTDVETARGAGLPIVAVTWGFRPREELEAAGVTEFVSTGEELARWLR
ncbi:MAG TPA: HAD-IA family hydrolase [Anaeromyxobacteraceae bacterium]|nr:HAD-IA family hydrolase [Anaeromyxobacteraceae bacterium]